VRLATSGRCEWAGKTADPLPLSNVRVLNDQQLPGLPSAQSVTDSTSLAAPRRVLHAESTSPPESASTTRSFFIIRLLRILSSTALSGMTGLKQPVRQASSTSQACSPTRLLNGEELGCESLA
jgi:hypothetical protein